MPLQQPGLFNFGSDIDQQVVDQIRKIFSMLDERIEKLSQANGLSPSQVKLLQPLHQCIIVGDSTIFVILATHELGGVSTVRFVDWSGKPMNIPTALFLAERDLGFKDAFTFHFARSVLNLDADNGQEAAVAQISQRCIDEEIVNIERQNKIVRLNPIFQGREFLINEQMVFVLSPFEEPFNTIFQDHIRPLVRRHRWA